MIVLIGASASGKTEIANILIKKYGYQKCITTTTRDKRTGEIDGVSYHFVSKDEFLKLREAKAFVEVTEYQNNYYGLQLRDMKEKGIVILDPNGANFLASQNLNCFFVYVFASKDIRFSRMNKRGDDIEAIQKRIASDDQVFDERFLNKIDLVVKNESSIDDAAKNVHSAYHNKH